MAQKRKPPRLYLRLRDGRAMWVIRDGTRMIATGCLEADKSKAEAVLNEYAYQLGVEPGAPSFQAPHVNNDGHVYFITCEAPGFPIKIGWTVDVKYRLQSLQVAMPYIVALLASIPGTRDDERKLHIGFAQHRMRGEWFARHPELMAFINSLRPREVAA